MSHYHQVRVTHIADKHNDAAHILEAAGSAYKVALAIEGKQFSSEELSEFLQRHERMSKEVAFIIGGPEGLPAEVINHANHHLSLGKLTLPHDLAMVVVLEALYRASTINSGHPYHK